MKTSNLIYSGIMVLAMTFTMISCQKETTLDAAKIPTEINAYTSTHFPSNKIIKAVEEKKGNTTKYEVKLDGNISLEFNQNKEIVEIESLTKLPDSVIPEKIRNYTTTNYQANFIKEWELNTADQKIKLDSGVELVFNLEGEFLRIDD
jgi:hypothetical protein